MEKKYPRVLFRKRLNDLSKDVEKIGDATINVYKDSVKTLFNYDDKLAQRVLSESKKIDEMNYHLEQNAMRVIAAEQPVARDLRFIEACIKVGSHLKRTGYLASNIVEVACHIKDEEIPPEPMNDIREMSKIVEKMIEMSLEAFLKQDMDISRKLHHEDDKVDDLFDKALKDISRSMFKEKDAISSLVYILFVARFLERIADRAETIGDRTIFMITCEKP